MMTMMMFLLTMAAGCGCNKGAKKTASTSTGASPSIKAAGSSEGRWTATLADGSSRTYLSRYEAQAAVTKAGGGSVVRA